MERNPELTFRLTPIHFHHPYLKQRRVEPLLAECFGIGFYTGAGSMQGRVAIPIHDQRGALVAYVGRSIDNTQPRYRFPSGFRKNLELYNLHRCSGTSVVLVEGFFDTLSVVQAGFDTVALMGVALSERQKGMLIRRFSEVVLLLDGDEAGRRASDHIGEMLRHAIRVRVGMVPDGRQPDCLRADEITEIVRKAVALNGRRP